MLTRIWSSTWLLPSNTYEYRSSAVEQVEQRGQDRRLPVGAVCPLPSGSGMNGPGSRATRSPVRMSTVSEKSKSLMSPSTITCACLSTARISSTKSLIACACAWRQPSSVPSAHRDCELREADGRLEAAEQRLVVALRAEVVGDDEHGLAAPAELAGERLARAVERVAPPRSASRTARGSTSAARAAAGVESAPRGGRTTSVSVVVEVARAGAVDEREARDRSGTGSPTRMLPPGAPPSALFDRVDLSILSTSARRRPRSRRSATLPAQVRRDDAVVGRCRCCPAPPRWR